MKESMFTYIKKEKDTNLNILNQRDKILHSFTRSLKQNKKSNWIILATGSSANAIECAKYYVESIAKINVSIQMPQIYTNYPSIQFDDQLHIAVSQSGHSSSTIKALKSIHGESFTMCADLKSPICKENKNIIEIACGFESVDIVTMGMSATILTFMLMGLEAARVWNVITQDKYDVEIKKLHDIIIRTDDVVEDVIKWYECHKEEFANIEQVAAIGYGTGYGIAKEMETKIAETIYCPVNAYEMEEYMHGPYLAMHKNLYVFFIETNHENQNKRMEALKSYMQNICEHCYTITYKSDEALSTFTIENIDELYAPLLYVIFVQYLSYRISSDRGIDPMITPYDDFDDVLASKI